MDLQQQQKDMANIDNINNVADVLERVSQCENILGT